MRSFEGVSFSLDILRILFLAAIRDPWHLIKRLRNSFLNSNPHNPSKVLKRGNEQVSWQTVVSTYSLALLFTLNQNERLEIFSGDGPSSLHQRSACDCNDSPSQRWTKRWPLLNGRKLSFSNERASPRKWSQMGWKNWRERKRRGEEKGEAEKEAEESDSYAFGSFSFGIHFDNKF